MLSGQFINATLVVQMWLFSSCNGNFKKFWKQVRVSWLSRKIRLMALYFSQELNKICNLEPFKLFCWLIQYSFCSFSLNVYDRFLIELDFQAMKSLGISLLLPAFQCLRGCLSYSDKISWRYSARSRLVQASHLLIFLWNSVGGSHHFSFPHLVSTNMRLQAAGYSLCLLD